MPASPNDITLEHIDPISHPLVSGLRNDFNEVMAVGSYNYSKRNLFVPYKGVAPQNEGDVCEFLIKGEWMMTEFLGEWWRMEAVRILQRFNKFGGPPKADWNQRIKSKEQLLGIKVIFCSHDGVPNKNSMSIKICKHGKSPPRELWRHLNPNEYCCKNARIRNKDGKWL
jgi:hypothetical protein